MAPDQPPAPETAASLFASHQQSWKRDSLQQELTACRQELASMQALINDLPDIFEGKFAARMQPLLEQKQRLMAGNQGLREQLSSLQAAALAPAGRLMAAADPESSDNPANPERSDGRGRWTRSLRHAFGLAARRRD